MQGFIRGSISGLGRSPGAGNCTPVLHGTLHELEEPGGLQSTGSQRLRQDWTTEHTCRLYSNTSISSPLVSPALSSVLKGNICWTCRLSKWMNKSIFSVTINLLIWYRIWFFCSYHSQRIKKFSFILHRGNSSRGKKGPKSWHILDRRLMQKIRPRKREAWFNWTLKVYSRF